MIGSVAQPSVRSLSLLHQTASFNNNQTVPTLINLSTMAEYRAEKAGMAAEAQAKVKSKYDEKLSKQILEWIAEITGITTFDTDGSEENFHEVLKNGTILCKLVNTLLPDTIKKFSPDSKLPFKCMDNINSFLLAVAKLGVPTEEHFQTVDLWEKVNLYSVQICLAALARKAPKLGHKGFGPKEAESNPRNFTEEQLRQGEGIINLQYGSNKGATQSGQSFGKMTRF